MQNNKLNNVVNEINDFIKNKMSLLLNDLLVQTNEYEETKKQILMLPFVQQIINDTVKNNNSNNEVTHKLCDIKIEPCDFSDEVKDAFFNVQNQIVEDSENIYLNIEDTVVCDDSSVEILDLHEQDDCHDEADIIDVEESEEEEKEKDEVVELEEQDDEAVELEEEADEAVESEQEEDVEEEVVEDKPEDEIDIQEDAQEEEEEPEQEEEEVDIQEENTPEEEEEGVFEIEINGVTYFTDDEKNGTIYSVDQNGDPDQEVGTFKNGKPTFL